jgi:hypothetical protein
MFPGTRRGIGSWVCGTAGFSSVCYGEKCGLLGVGFTQGGFESRGGEVRCDRGCAAEAVVACCQRNPGGMVKKLRRNNWEGAGNFVHRLEGSDR